MTFTQKGECAISSMQIRMQFGLTKALLSPGNMHTHVLRVHTRVQEKTNKCDRCSCAFKTAGSLRTHISKYHDKKAKAAEEEEPEEVTRPQSRLREYEYLFSFCFISKTSFECIELKRLMSRSKTR